MNREILKFEHVTAGYGKKDAVRDFSCCINRGEFVSLIGPNGSGKSTLIHTITGVVPLRSGKVYLNGKDSNSISSKERAQIVAVVPQNFQADFAFKAKEIVAMGRHPFLKPMHSETEEDYRIIDDALKQTGTFHLRERKITQLSGGERQRIIISAALAQRPELLILDEPTNHLDIQYTLEIMELMRRLNQEQGITVFAVLHDINMAARFSDRIIILREGQMVQDGTTKEVIREEVLKPVYKIDLVVRNNTLLNSAEIIALRSNKTEKRLLNGQRVHIICGGGSGSFLIEGFHNRGWEVSCGVLSPGDSDYALCQSMGVQLIEEKPYCEIGQKAYEKNLHAVRQADVVVLADVDIGRINLKNIQVLEEADKEICVLREQGKDYSGGQADAILSRLSEKGNVINMTRIQLMDTFFRTESQRNNMEI